MIITFKTEYVSVICSISANVMCSFLKINFQMTSAEKKLVQKLEKDKGFGSLSYQKKNQSTIDI